MATQTVTWTDGQEAVRSGLLNGDGDVANVKAFLAAMSGDIVIKCTPATKNKTATSAAWEETIVVTLETNAGVRHSWYNGNITLAVGDTSTAGTAAISPAAGARQMTDGALTVTLSGAAASWLATETATLTASVTSNNPGLVAGSLIANATSVITFTS